MAKASKIPVAARSNLPAAVSIQRPCYAMATTDGQSADITMYGEIVEEQPVDWGTGEPIPGQYIIESEFLDDLNRISGCDNITIHMDSLGGNAGVSILVHNKLRDLAAKGAKLTCIVDGVAMSGGSLIMCACDTVKVNPSSLVMIHKCWSFIWGAYNAEDLRKAADVNDAWDKSQVSIYKRKTGMSETVLLHMMADTTYMTGKEAVEKGFADELLDDAEPLEISASADSQTISCKGHALRLMPGVKLPDNIPLAKAPAPVAPAAANTKTAVEPANTNEGGQTPMANETKFFPATSVEITAPGCGHLMYGQITQIDYGQTDFTSYVAKRVPKLIVDQANDLRKLRYACRPLAAPKNYTPWIYMESVID